MKTRYLSIASVSAGLSLVSFSARAQSTVSLDLPVEVTTQSIQAALEKSVPTKVEKLAAWEFHGNTGVRYGAWRGPIRVFVAGNAVRVTALVNYAMSACERVDRPRWMGGAFCPQIAQCGFNGPVPQIEVTIDISGTWSPNWAFVPIVVTQTRAIRPCLLTIANINVSDRATGFLRSRIESETHQIEQMLHFRPRAEQVWNGVKPMLVADHLWLSWQLDRVTVDPLLWSPGRVSTMVTLAATPTLVQEAPVSALSVFPGQLTIGRSAFVAQPSWRLGAETSWNEVTTVLKKAFGTYNEGKEVKVSLQSLSASADGRIRAEFALQGAPVSALVVSADVRYDPGTETASLDQVKLETNPAPLSDVLVPASVLAAVQARMRWQLQPFVQSAVSAASVKLNAAGLMSGPVESGAHVESLAVNGAGLSMTVVVPGRLQVQISSTP